MNATSASLHLEPARLGYRPRMRTRRPPSNERHQDAWRRAKRWSAEGGLQTFPLLTRNATDLSYRSVG